MQVDTVFVLDDFGTSVTPPGSTTRNICTDNVIIHMESCVKVIISKACSPQISLNSPMKRPNQPMIPYNNKRNFAAQSNAHLITKPYTTSIATQTGLGQF